MDNSSDRIKCLLARSENKTEQKEQKEQKGSPVVRGYNSDAGKYDLQLPNGAIVDAALQTSGSVSESQLALSGSGVIIDKDFVPRGRRRRYRRRQPVYPFKVLFRRTTASGIEIYLGGDQPPRLITTLPTNNIVSGSVVSTGYEPDECKIFLRYYRPVLDFLGGLEIVQPGQPSVLISYPVTQGLLYSGHGFWWEVSRPTLRNQEQAYSGQLDAASFDNSSSVGPIFTEQATRNIKLVNTDQIRKFGYDPGGVNPDSCEYSNFDQFGDEVITARTTTTTTSFKYLQISTSVAGMSESILSYALGEDAVEAFSQGTTYSCRTENIRTVTNFFYNDICPYTPYPSYSNTQIFRYLCINIPPDSGNSTRSANFEQRTRVAPGRIIRGYRVDETFLGISEVQSILVGPTSEIFSYSTDGNQAVRYYAPRGGSQTVLPTYNNGLPLSGFFSTLYGQRNYHPRISDFNNNRQIEWESTIDFHDVLTGERGTEQGFVQSLNFSNATILSISYYKDEQN